MIQNVENELKTIVTKEQFDQLLSFYPGLEFKDQHNYYYFTDDLSHYCFRIREMNDYNLFTIKQYVDGNTIETETKYQGNFKDNVEIIEELRKNRIYPPYMCYGDLLTKRAVYDNGLAELCFDINEYNGIVDYEIEYEEKQSHDILTAFKEILAQAGIEYVPSWASKYKRCLATLNNKR